MSASVLVTGGAGYIGSVLVPKLLEHHRVVVLDTLWFGNALPTSNPRLSVVEGDIRDAALVGELLAGEGVDTVIHLAAISNDPSADLDAELTRSINFLATRELMEQAKRAGVSRFINASSASVYGIKDELEVTEDLTLEPRTLYARYKAQTEDVLGDLVNGEFCGVSVRSATVCGYSPRLRLDLTINILTHHALVNGAIRVFGGDQLRPNIHVRDLADFYVHLVGEDATRVNGRAFNVSTRNASVMELAQMVRAQLDASIGIDVVPTDDDRSYRLSAQRARRELGFSPRLDLAEAVRELRAAYGDGRVRDPGALGYRNVELMQRHPEWIRPLSAVQ